MKYISKKGRKLISLQESSKLKNKFTFFAFHHKSKKGFTLLEVLTASVVVTIVSYLIITQSITLQQKIEKHTKLPQQTFLLLSALSDATPVDDNFNKGKTYSYESKDYNWQIRREVIKIYQDEKNEYFLEQYILSINLPQENGEENKKDISLLKTIEEEKDTEEQTK